MQRRHICFLCSSLTFEKAYCEYRLNRTSDALATIESATKPDNRLQELQGQVVCNYVCLVKHCLYEEGINMLLLLSLKFVIFYVLTFQ